MTKRKEHVVWVTLGEPYEAEDAVLARWHGACSCGWRGQSMVGERAQIDALSHAAGHPVRPVRVRRRVFRHKGSRVPASNGYGVVR